MSTQVDDDCKNLTEPQPSTRCHKFIACGYTALARDLLDNHEVPPKGNHCSICHFSLATKPPSRRDLYYCKDCLSPVHQCGDCVISSHHMNPFHCVHCWEPMECFWLCVTLKSIGYEFCLEHSRKRCPKAPSKARDFMVVHDHGIDCVPIVLCACLNPLPLTTQLMHAGLWPAMWEQPCSAITLTALKVFQSLTVTAHTTAHNFVTHLQKLTDIIAPKDVKVKPPPSCTFCSHSSTAGPCAQVLHRDQNVRLHPHMPPSWCRSLSTTACQILGSPMPRMSPA